MTVPAGYSAPPLSPKTTPSNFSIRGMPCPRARHCLSRHLTEEGTLNSVLGYRDVKLRERRLQRSDVAIHRLGFQIAILEFHVSIPFFNDSRP
jgi:hypothetical protein